jgi:hypothetical protein
MIEVLVVNITGSVGVKPKLSGDDALIVLDHQH